MDYRQTYVTDANIWIDLHAGGLARRVFDLPARFAAPDVIVQELLSPMEPSSLDTAWQATSYQAVRCASCRNCGAGNGIEQCLPTTFLRWCSRCGSRLRFSLVTTTSGARQKNTV